jgi:hypothetical protein
MPETVSSKQYVAIFLGPHASTCLGAKEGRWLVGVKLSFWCRGRVQGSGVSPQERKEVCLPNSPDSAVC